MRFFNFLMASSIGGVSTAFGAIYTQNALDIDLGISTESYTYREFESNVSDKQIMQISGAMYGLQGRITHNTSSSFRHSLSGGYFYGANTRYKGSACEINNPQNCSPVEADSNDYYYYAQYIINPHIKFRGIDIGYNIGAGYRFLFNKVKNSSAYRRDQHYAYYIIGLNLGSYVFPSIYASLTAHYRGIFHAWNKTYMTDIGFDKDVSFKQNRGSGYYVELRFDYQAKGGIAPFIAAYYKYWNILDSNIKPGFRDGAKVGDYIEPNNFTHSFGANIGLRF